MRPFRVAICQHRLLHYRVGFFELLREQAADRGVDIRLIHGQASPSQKLKNDEGSLPWAEQVHNSWLTVGGVELLWQHLPQDIGQADLVVLMQENRILSNYPLILQNRLRGRPMTAFWGHGVNFQSLKPQGLREGFKRRIMTRVDYWFAYTKATRDILLAADYPAGRITTLNNSIDTKAFRAQCENVTPARKQELRRGLGIPDDAPVGLFCGSLYPEKRLELLFLAGDLIRRIMPDYHVVVVGNGPALPVLEEAAATRPWLHLVGVKRGIEKAEFFSLAQVMLNPGAVGLHILDSFAAGLPMATTREALHGPEIAYAEDYRFDIAMRNSPRDYAEGVLAILSDPGRRRMMSEAALKAAEKYSLESMSQNFLGGIEACRALGPVHRPA